MTCNEYMVNNSDQTAKERIESIKVFCPDVERKEITMDKNKPYIPSSIVGMMRERGYTGSDNVGYYEAKKWLCKKYNAWLSEIPRYLTPIDLNSEYWDAPYDHKVLMWEVVARDITSWMPGDYYCGYFAIHQEDNPTEQALEDADVFGVEVCEDSGKYYKSPEDAICAGLICAMLWLS